MTSEEVVAQRSNISLISATVVLPLHGSLPRILPPAMVDGFTGWIFVSMPLTPLLTSLENEAIHIFREVIAEAENAVLLYSIGKDSSVLLHLAMKAFYPSQPPFPLLHIDTTWKFREMIAFRGETAARLGLRLDVHTK